MTTTNPQIIISAIRSSLPPIMRWCGAVAKRLRQFNIAVDGKASGNANTDALTLADLSVQELLVAALRDADPVLRTCRIEGEESTGDMERFSSDSSLAIAIDPIDGTKQYRDHSGNGYSIIVHLHDESSPLYSLVFAPEMGNTGTWVEVESDRIVCGADDVNRSARQVLDSLPNLKTERPQHGNGIYLIGFQQLDTQRAREVDALGLEGRTSDEMPGSIYPFMATGEYAGSLIHSPNIYDFPVSMHIARVLGGDAVWCHSREPVHYRELWMDDRAGMLRFPAVVACSDDRRVMNQLCELAKDWPQQRYV
ncbi:MAG: inositol monophosphatase [Planctomycetaceae bacterium]|nr:inositol monophosphatase [Planctomycetaceae bacterium]